MDQNKDPQKDDTSSPRIDCAASTSTTISLENVTSTKDIDDMNDLEKKLENISINDGTQIDGSKKSKENKKAHSKGNKVKGISATSEMCLSSPTIEAVSEYIKSGKCKNVIFMVGAGISTSAGIPDFRSPETGLFSQLEKYNLPYPEAVFDIGFFKSNPKPFFHLARELFPGNFAPTPCHHFMKLIHDKEILLRLYTQNIDSLERIAGIPADKLIESHGTFHTAHCINKRCRKEYSLEWMKKIVLDKDLENNVPRCEQCQSLVKPDIIFYGEMLPDRFYQLIETDFTKCDMLIIIGTSLTVQPFASLVDFVGKNVPRLLINFTKPEGSASLISKFIPGLSTGMDFKSKSNVRNVFMKSDADSGCKLLAEMLGWKDDLDKLITNNNNKVTSI